MNIVMLSLIYILGGICRGAVLYNISTVIIEMYQKMAQVPYDHVPDLVSIISVSATIGSIISSIVSTQMVRKFGARSILIFTTAISLISCCLVLPSIHWIYLFVFKFISGFSSCFTISLIPMVCAQYISVAQRPIVGSLYSVSLVLSMVVCNVIQFFISSEKQLYWVIQVLSIVSSAFLLILSLKTPKEKHEVLKSENVYSKKYTKCFLVAFIIGISIAGTGYNPILQFSTLIFKNSFNSPKSGTIGAIITSSINLISATISIPVVRRFKRKVLLIVGSILMLLSYTVTILALKLVKDTKLQNNIVLGATISFIFFYSCSSGSLFFVLIGEVFPKQLKMFFMNFVMVIHFVGTMVTTFIFPIIDEFINYILYIGFCSINLILIVKFLPETKGKSFEEIEREMITESRKVVLKDVEIGESGETTRDIVVSAETEQGTEIK
ncbi:Sugar_(And other) transporter family protein [Hexamita inflata]|uniref:Sugar (And other) transporter family protein n=1 Tax=Hexamita inflata TaxID=28002 RepID=A0AA86Q085_9EUKA|nr:Sugar (And other) transporter family protein [Hexamita inflata]